MMKETRERLMDKVIRALGFENEWTIWFCQVCEDVKATDQMIYLAYVEALDKGLEVEEE